MSESDSVPRDSDSGLDSDPGRDVPAPLDPAAAASVAPGGAVSDEALAAPAAPTALGPAEVSDAAPPDPDPVASADLVLHPVASADLVPDPAAVFPGPAHIATHPAADPCREARILAEERCAAATALSARALDAANALRVRRRESDDRDSRAAGAADRADPRLVRSAKEAAQQRFRAASRAAGSPAEVESAARTWLLEVNRINAEARAAALALRREREALNALVPILERLSVEADAARIVAERARETCLAAREAVVDCEEEALRRQAPAGPTPGAAMPGAPSPQPTATAEAAAAAGPAVTAAPAAGAEPPAGAERAAGASSPTLSDHPVPSMAPDITPTRERTWPSFDETAGSPGAAEPDEPDATLADGAGRTGTSRLLRVLAGDRATVDDLIERLSAGDAVERPRWELRIAELVEALIARAIDGASLDFPADHPFWGLFTRAQSRDIAGALASLGYRHDAVGGFQDDRIPGQRDLSLAVGFAGLDPMRIRRWPTEAELPDLLRGVTVAAGEFVIVEAPGLTLGEMVSLLGRRADGLTELWNAWARVRPLLLATD